MQDQVSNHQVHRFLDPQLPTATGDVDSAIIEIKDFDALTIINIGGVSAHTWSAANKYDFKLLHGDTNVEADMTAVEQKDVVGTTVASGGIVWSFREAKAGVSPTSALPVEFSYAYVGPKKYVMQVITIAGTISPYAPVGAIAVSGIASNSDSNAKPDWRV